MASSPAFTTVTVAANVAPVILPNVTYTVSQGSSLTLGGGGLATDPNGDALTYGWDFTGSGVYTGSTDAQPVYTWYGSGNYTVGLRASDSLLATTGTVSVTVQNVAPTVNAGPDQTVTRSTVTFHGSFTDPGSAAEIYTKSWNFGDGSPEASGSLDAVHTYRANGAYTATLTVADDAGGIGTDSLSVQVSVLKGDVDENGAVNLVDAILALQIASGITPASSAYSAADVDGSGKIGPEEAVFILQVVAGLRP
jgi:PKD repeat protein